MSKLEEMPISEVVNCIITLNESIRKFWTKADSWAPIEAAQLLSKSRLDWQVSLSRCLKIWPKEFPPSEETGRLILAWANLGSLVEGTMKLLLSVYYEDYKKDDEAIKRKKKGKRVEELKVPDALGLEEMRQFFKKRIWRETWDKEWDEWTGRIQRRRNAIHAYQSRNIGNFDEFFVEVRKYLEFLRYINGHLPYPDNIYTPHEA